MKDTFPGWDGVGRAAEQFARQVAREAGRFAKRVEEHFSELADDVRGTWRDDEGACAGEHGPADEVRRAFREVRGVLRAVVDGVDEVIDDLFGGGEDEPWGRVVANREASCAGCGAAIAAGADAWARRRGRRPEFRCAACGAGPQPTVGV